MFLLTPFCSSLRAKRSNPAAEQVEKLDCHVGVASSAHDGVSASQNPANLLHKAKPPPRKFVNPGEYIIAGDPSHTLSEQAASRPVLHRSFVAIRGVARVSGEILRKILTEYT